MSGSNQWIGANSGPSRRKELLMKLSSKKDSVRRQTKIGCKSSALILSLFMLFSLVVALPVYAQDNLAGDCSVLSPMPAAIALIAGDEGVRQMPSKTTDDCQKPWHIKFSQAVDPGSINGKTIMITDLTQGVNIPIEFAFSEDNQTVTCSPRSNYEPGEKRYQLTITKEVKAANDGPCLGKVTVMNFTLKQASSNPISSLTLTADPEITQNVNLPVILTATAIGGNNLQYEFQAKHELGEWEVIQPFSSSNTCTFSTDVAGVYAFKVGVHSAGSSTDYEKEAELDCYNIGGYGWDQMGCKLWPEPLPPQPAGTPITLRATSYGIDPPEYTYLVVSPDGSTAEEVIECYVPQTSVTWTPTEAGRNYHLRLWVGYQGSKKGTISDDIWFQTK